MKRNMLQLGIPLFLSLLIISGCSGYLTTGHLRDNTIPPVAFSKTSKGGIWQSKDIVISYTIHSLQPVFSLSGTLSIDSAIVMSYPVVRSFFVRIHFLDADGNLVDSSLLPLDFSLYNFADQQSTFRISREIPSRVTAFTFSYSGTFSDYGEKFPDTTSIGYSPFQ